MSAPQAYLRLELEQLLRLVAALALADVDTLAVHLPQVHSTTIYSRLVRLVELDWLHRRDALNAHGRERVHWYVPQLYLALLKGAVQVPTWPARSLQRAPVLPVPDAPTVRPAVRPLVPPPQYDVMRAPVWAPPPAPPARAGADDHLRYASLGYRC